MANIYTGLALISWAAKAAAKSKAYKVRPDGTVVFRLHVSVGIYGFIGTLATAACAFVPDTAAMLLMMATIGPLFVPFFMYFLFARIYISDDKIAYRNPFGIRREIAWKDLNAAVSIGITGDIVLCGGGKKIRLYPYYSGFPHVLELLRQYRPEAFDEEFMLAHAAEFRKAGDGDIQFRCRKHFRTLALAIMLYGCVYILMPDRIFTSSFSPPFDGKLIVAAIFMLCGLPFLLLYANTRLYLDDEKIVYRNMLSFKRQARWEDIESYRSIEKGMLTYIRIHYGHNKKISVGGEFFGYGLIKHIVHKTGMQKRIRFW